MSIVSIFLIVLIAAFATIAYFTEPSDAEKRIHQRMSTLGRPAMQGEDDQAAEIVRQVTFSRIGWLDRYLRQSRPALQLQLWLDQAKVPWTVGRFVFYSACFMLVGAIVGNWWIPVGFLGWILGLALGLTPLLWVAYQRSKRFSAFNLLLPDAIDLIARALRAGHSLPSALVTVAEEIPDPLGPEFQRSADEMNYGLPFRESMNNLFQRFPIPDLQFLITAILMQRETGGNLPELLDKTAAVLRARIQLQQKVRVHTAQGRMTGAILIAMPFAAFVLTNLIRPGYTAPLFETEIGHKLIYGTLISMALGTIVIRRIIQVKY
jgi:tight adherence protein B